MARAPEPAPPQEICQTHRLLNGLSSAELHEQALAAVFEERWDEAERAALQATEVSERESGADSPGMANLSNLLSQIAEARGHYADAERYAARAWVITERLGDRLAGPIGAAIRGEATGRLGAALYGAGRYDEAEPWLVRSLEYAERAGFGVVAALNNLGLLYKRTGNFVKAELLYRLALKMVPNHSHDAAVLYHNLGGLAMADGRLDEGESDGRRAWEIRRGLREGEHPETLADASEYAVLIDGLGPARREITASFQNPIAARQVSANSQNR